MIDPAEERANFISLYEILFFIAEEKCLSSRDAAEWLALNLNKNQEWQTLPFKWYSKLKGFQDCDGEHAKWIIERLAEDGQWDEDYIPATYDFTGRHHPGFDVYGFERASVMPLLEKLLNTAPASTHTEGETFQQNHGTAHANTEAIECENAELRSQLEALKKAVDQLSAQAPLHPVRLMDIAVKVQHRYWGKNWNREDPSTNTRQGLIVEWIRNQYPELSNDDAESIEKVACPIDRNPAKKRNK